jgi:hypothetical protein
MEGAEEEPRDEFSVMNFEDDYSQTLYPDQGQGLLPEYYEYLEQVKGLSGILFDCGFQDYLSYSIKHVMLANVDRVLGQVKDRFDQPFLRKL